MSGSDEEFQLEVDSEPDFRNSTVSEHDKGDTKKGKEGGKSNSMDLKKENETTSSSNKEDDDAEVDQKKDADSKPSDKPCHNFRADLKATQFGMCKCGHLKTAHGAKETNKAKQMLNNHRVRNSAANAEEMEDGKQDEPCSKYRVDPVAKTFGDCKCGHPKLAHGPQKVNKAEQALKNLKKGNSTKYIGAPRASIQPCDNYRVDTTADEFGVCLCGFKKDDHVEKQETAAERYLREMKERNAKRNELEDQAAMKEQPLPSETEEDVSDKKEVGELNKQESKAEAKAPVDNAVSNKGSCCTIC